MIGRTGAPARWGMPSRRWPPSPASSSTRASSRPRWPFPSPGGRSSCSRAPPRVDPVSKEERTNHMAYQPLKGQKALVTGASSGIGEGVARALGAAGADVVVNYVSNPEIAAKIVEEIKTSGVDALALHADVCKEAEVEAMFSAMLSAW